VVVGAQRIPRLTQLLALAITSEDMIRTGEARNYADIARRTGVSRARIYQITRLLDMPPETQEQMLLPERPPSLQTANIDVSLSSR
jgi:uncharacterized protein YerC